MKPGLKFNLGLVLIGLPTTGLRYINYMGTWGYNYMVTCAVEGCGAVGVGYE